MFVESRERSTGMGATRYAAVAVDGKWVRLSNVEGARYHGRINGEHVYSLDVPDDAVSASFYRSNSGREEVTIFDGKSSHSVYSFEDANWWLVDWTAAEVAHKAAMAAGPAPADN